MLLFIKYCFLNVELILSPLKKGFLKLYFHSIYFLKNLHEVTYLWNLPAFLDPKHFEKTESSKWILGLRIELLHWY